MSLAVAIDSALKESPAVTAFDLAQTAERTVIDALKESALRSDVYERVDNKSRLGLEDLTMTHVHEILDALIEVLEGRDV